MPFYYSFLDVHFEKTLFGRTGGKKGEVFQGKKRKFERGQLTLSTEELTIRKDFNRKD